MKNKKIRIITSFFLFILFSVFYFLPSVSAFESTSATFEIHAGDAESTVASSTSATFWLHNAGGQNATASSSLTTTSISSGILYWLYGFFAARYDQIHYRWREDDAGCTESSTAPSCWLVAVDTQYNPFPVNTAKRLRFEVSNEGASRGSSPSFTLEFAELSSGSDCANGPFATNYIAVPTSYSLHMHLATSTPVSDATWTTDVGTPPTTGLTNANSNFIQGQVKTTGNTTGSITLNSDNFTEVEYGVSATSLATGGAMYCFRLNDNITPTRMVYSNYAKAQLSSGLPATGTLDSAIFDTFDGGGAWQGPAYNSVMWRGNQNSSLGKVQFQFATSDCSNGKTNYPACNDAGAWTFYGSQGGNCNTNNYYDTDGTDIPVELSCSPSYHNNQRYFRYRVRICTSNCSTSGDYSPIIEDIIVNWSP